MNPNAKSCSLDIESGSVEWSIVYDDKGQPLFPENRYHDDDDFHRLEKLGIYKSAYEQVDVLGDLFWDDSQNKR